MPALLEQKREVPLAHATGATMDELVSRHLPMVYSTCLRITRNRHDAEDATQAVFLCLAIQVRQRSAIRNMGPWLHRVASRASLDLLRRRKRKLTHEYAGGMALLQRQGAAKDADSSFRELHSVMLRALDELPSRYRMPLVLHYFSGQSYEQLASDLGCNRTTLRVRLHRGHKLLREALEQRGISLAGGLLGVVLAEAVRSQVSDSLVTSTLYLGQQAARCGPQSCCVPHDVMHAAYGAAGRGIRVKLLLALAAAGVVGASAWGTPLLAKLVNDPPRLPEIRDVCPIPKLQLNTAIPGISDAAPANSPAGASPQTAAHIRPGVAVAPQIASRQAESIVSQRTGTPVAYANPWFLAQPVLPGSAEKQGQTASAGNASVMDLFHRVSEVHATGEARATELAPAHEIHQRSWHAGPQPIAPIVQHNAPLVPTPPGTEPGPSPVAPPAITNITAIASATGSPWSSMANPMGDSWTHTAAASYFDAMCLTMGTANASRITVSSDSNGRELHLTYYDGTTTPTAPQTPPARIINILDNNGQVVSDSRTNVKDYSSYDKVTNTFDNTRYNGWFAMTGGKITLPAIHMARGSGTYNWGESADDKAIDLINSVSLRPEHVRQSGNMKISLLACEGPLETHYSLAGGMLTATSSYGAGDFPAFPAGHHLLGMWSLDSTALIDGGIGLTIRYDDARIASLGGDAGLVKLWYYDDGWQRVTDASFWTDTPDHLVGGHIPSASTYFAVSLPEPAMGLMVLLAGSSQLLHRRRRRTEV